MNTENLPNDVARCLGVLGLDAAEREDVPVMCPHTLKCKRWLPDVSGLQHNARTPMISNCLVDGEYTLRLDPRAGNL